MKIFLGITDYHWFQFLKEKDFDDVNFWSPGGVTFKALQRHEPFLFKLKAPINAIGGVGFFSEYISLPLSMAWEVFEQRNGVSDQSDFEIIIKKYRSKLGKPAMKDPSVGCVVLSNPIFLSPMNTCLYQGVGVG